MLSVVVRSVVAVVVEEVSPRVVELQLVLANRAASRRSRRLEHRRGFRKDEIRGPSMHEHFARRVPGSMLVCVRCLECL